MAGDRDRWPIDEWPNDDEANDIMLTYAADDDHDIAGSGCAGVIMILIIAGAVVLTTVF